MKLRYSRPWKLVVMLLPYSWVGGNEFFKLVVPRHHSCGKFSTLVVPILQITHGFATRVENLPHLWCL
jgi:hypothetical protein